MGDGLFAYLQPDGSWGWSNAGLVSEGDHCLLIDTLFDLRLTEAMLRAMRDAVPAAARFDALVNTHSNGDHWFGNQLVPTSRILATSRCLEEMLKLPPSALAEMVEAGPDLGTAGAYLREIFAPFQFSGITPTPATETFEGQLSLTVGDREVHLRDLGPAHMGSDVIAYVPSARVVFTGDLLFVGGHPMTWAGPSENWIRALDHILALDLETIVPGHGPVTDKEGVATLKAYWLHLRAEARQRYDAGLPPLAAARDIPLGDFAGWTDRERVVANVMALYREFAGGGEPATPLELFAQMAAFRALQ